MIIQRILIVFAFFIVVVLSLSAADSIPSPGVLNEDDHNNVEKNAVQQSDFVAEEQEQPVSDLTRAEAGEIFLEPGTKKVLTVRGIEYVFRWCPPGEFLSGAWLHDEYGPGKPGLPMKISSGFWILESEVTQEMWESVIGSTVSELRGKAHEGAPLSGVGPNFPVYYVNASETSDFCSRLSRLAHCRITIPTSVQWEYACLVGSELFFEPEKLDEVCWYRFNSGNRVHEVKTKAPNAWGIYDMQGNLWEWCAEHFPFRADSAGDNRLGPGMPGMPLGATRDTHFEIRGGCWLSPGDFCQVNVPRGFKLSLPNDIRDLTVGFRIILIPGTNE